MRRPSKMSQFDRATTCRLCASQIQSGKSVPVYELADPSKWSAVGEMMVDCFFGEVQPGQGFPEVVCQLCHLQLNVFHAFKRKVLEHHEQFSRCIQQAKENQPALKIEVCDEETECLLIAKDEHSETDTSEPVAVFDVEPFLVEQKARVAESDVDLAIDVQYLEDVNESINHDSNAYEMLDEQYLDPSDECTLPDSPDAIAEIYLLDDDQENMTIEYIDSEEMSESECEQPGSTYQCSICLQQMQNRAEYQMHMLNKHRQVKIACETCGKFVDPELMDKHINSHHIRHFKCSICSKGFTTQAQCTAHEFRHTNLRPLACMLCDKSFKLKCDLRVHMNCHNDVRKYTCDICQKSFRMHSHLTNHRETHNTQNTLPCPECGLLFKTSVTLKSHIKQVHCVDHAYRCSICDRTFYRRNKLEKHLMSHEKKARKTMEKS